jgi:integrase
VEARHAKNRKKGTVELPPWLGQRLAEERQHQATDRGRPVQGQDPVFVVPTTKVLLKQLRKDAEFAGIGIHDDQGRRLDFHSFRVTFATLLARAGVHPKVAQRLLRHSDIKTTMDIYTKVDEEDVTVALAKLPVPKGA